MTPHLTSETTNQHGERADVKNAMEKLTVVNLKDDLDSDNAKAHLAGGGAKDP